MESTVTSDCSEGLDVEAFRERERLTYARLKQRLGLALPTSHVRRIALGEMWPRSKVIDQILKAAGGTITVDAMHKRYSARHSEAA